MTATWEVIANWETVEIADLGTKEPGNQAKASHEVGRMRRDLRERLQDLIVRKSGFDVLSLTSIRAKVSPWIRDLA